MKKIKLTEENIKSLLAVLVEQARALATRVAGDPEREAPCYFCKAPLPLWENLLVMQMTGVAAHIQCPPEALAEAYRETGPAPEFPYEEFSAAIDARLERPVVLACSGVIEIDP